MKKNIITLLFIALISIGSTATTSDPTTLFLGSIHFPHTIKDTNLCLFYKGQKIDCSFDEKHAAVEYSFIESKYTQKIYFIICTSISCETEITNTIQNLTISSPEYKCYELQATRIHNDDTDSYDFGWNIESIELQDNAIPENSIIFLFDPTLINTLSVKTWKKNNSLRMLPNIIMNNEATEHEFNRAMIIGRLASMDVDAIHTKPSLQEKNTKAIVTAMY